MRKNQERRSDHRDEKETRRVQDGVNQIKKHHRGPGCDASCKTGRGGDLGFNTGEVIGDEGKSSSTG